MTVLMGDSVVRDRSLRAITRGHSNYHECFGGGSSARWLKGEAEVVSSSPGMWVSGAHCLFLRSAGKHFPRGVLGCLLLGNCSGWARLSFSHLIFPEAVYPPYFHFSCLPSNPTFEGSKGHFCLWWITAGQGAKTWRFYVYKWPGCICWAKPQCVGPAGGSMCLLCPLESFVCWCGLLISLLPGAEGCTGWDFCFRKESPGVGFFARRVQSASMASAVKGAQKLGNKGTGTWGRGSDCPGSSSQVWPMTSGNGAQPGASALQKKLSALLRRTIYVITISQF